MHAPKEESCTSVLVSTLCEAMISHANLIRFNPSFKEQLNEYNFLFNAANNNFDQCIRKTTQDLLDLALRPKQLDPCLICKYKSYVCINSACTECAIPNFEVCIVYYNCVTIAKVILWQKARRSKGKRNLNPLPMTFQRIKS